MVVDDFSSMEPHMGRVKKVARVISYVAKTADDNGMELYPASKTADTPLICKTSSQVEKAIGRMETVGGTCDMGACLDNVLGKVLVGDKIKPTSIYIYTDGVWERDTNVERVIDGAIDHLYKRGQSSKTLMLQFVQFGDNEHGTEKLRYLDNQCTRQTKTEN
jgi:hypothetical protein